MLQDSRVQALLAVVATVAAVGITIAIVDNGPDHPPGTPRRTVTVTLGGPGHKQIPLDPGDQRQLKAQKAEDAAGQTAESESDLHDTTPAARSELAQASKVAPPGS